jgi:hypothetical protein
MTPAADSQVRSVTYALAQNLLWSTFTQLAIVIGRVVRGGTPGFSHPVGSLILWLGLPLYAVAWCLLVGAALALLLSLAGARVRRRDCLRAALYTSPAPYVVATAMCVGPGRTLWALVALIVAMSMNSRFNSSRTLPVAAHPLFNSSRTVPATANSELDPATRRIAHRFFSVGPRLRG